MKKLIVTTSWDDGHKLDIKLAHLLDKYGIKGTFYIPKKYTIEPLSEIDIKEIARNHEIGAHTLTHPELDKIDLKIAENEIKGSKLYLENIIDREVKMFCYPRGKYNEDIKNSVKSAGYIGARSTQKFCIEKPKDNYEFGATLHIYPFPFRKKDARTYFKNRYLFEPIFNNYKKIRQIKLPLSSFFSWSALAVNLFNKAKKDGLIFHLYGHSWEIGKYDMWKNLENFFIFINNQREILYLTNSNAIRYFTDGKNNLL